MVRSYGRTANQLKGAGRNMAKKPEQQEAPEVTDSTPEDGSSNSGESDSGAVIQASELISQLDQQNRAMMQGFIEWGMERCNSTDADQFAIMASIMREVMESETPAEVLRERSALHALDIIGQPLILHGFDLREGEYEDSLFPFYAALTCSRQASATTRVVTTGASKVLVKLYKLDQLGEWPQLIMFTAKKTSNGYEAVDMVTPSVV